MKNNKKTLFDTWRQTKAITNKLFSMNCLMPILLICSPSTLAFEYSDPYDPQYCSSNSNTTNWESIDDVIINGKTSDIFPDVSNWVQKAFPVISLPAGEASNITIIPKFSGSSYLEYYGVYIDINRNGTFEDDEKVFSTGPSSSTVNGSFTLPEQMVTGANRMRVIQDYHGPISQCGTYEYGQTVDFDINITAPSRKTLHHVTGDHYEGFVASTLKAGESLISSDGVSRLIMQPDGNLVLHNNNVETWSSNTVQNDSESFSFTFHVVHNGIEIRRNNDVIWSRYPPGVAANTNYLLAFNGSTLKLNDLEDKKIRWKVSNTANGFLNDSLTDLNIELLYAKAGWVHTLDWDSADHDNFNRKHRDLSFFHAHEFYQGMTDAAKKVGAVAVDAWDEAVSFEQKVSVAIHDEMMVGATKILEKVSASQVSEFASDFANLVEGLHDENIDLTELFEDEIAHLADGYVLPDYLNDIIAGVDDITIAEGRRLTLAEPDTQCNKYGTACTWLSKSQNAGKRLDYALEIDPTAVMTMLKVGKAVNASAGWVNQMQFRLFFTHPRLNAAGRYYTEIRLRLLDFAGLYGAAGIKNTYGAVDIGADGGLVTVRDIILPYTWAKDATFANGRKFEGAKYLAVTGVMAEVSLDATLNLDKIKDLEEPNMALSRLSNVVQSVEGVEGITGVELIAQTAGEIVEFASGLGGATEVEAVLGSIAELPSKFGSNLGFEIGLGYTPTAFYFDLNEMRTLALSKNFPTELTGVGFHLFTIISTEILGEAGLVAAGFLSGLNEAAFVTNWGAGLALANAEVMLGGMIGDMTYYGVHRLIYGESDAVSWLAETFWWGSGKLGASFFNAQSWAAKADEKFGTTGHSSGIPIKFRVQINGSWGAKEFFSSGKKQLKPYGSFQLKAKSGYCFKYRTNRRDIVQRQCRSNDDKNSWMAKPFGTPGESTYQLRSQFDGKCIATNDTVSNSSNIKVEACDSSLNQRFKVRIVSGKMTFASVLNETMCFDDTGGTKNVYMWSCNRGNENQHFTVDYSTGIDAEKWTDLKRSGAIKHTIRAKDATNCIDTSTNNPVNGTLSKLAACETDLENSNQTYYLVKTDGGHIKILHSNTHAAVVSGDRAYLGQSNASTFQATFLTLDANWTDWLVLVQDDGSVKFQNRGYGTCLQQEDEQIFARACQSENDAGQRFIINIDKYNQNQGYEL